MITHPDDRQRPLYYKVRLAAASYDFGSGHLVPGPSSGQVVYYPDWRNIAPPADAGEPTRDPYQGEARPLAPDGAVLAHFPLNRMGGLRGIPDMAAAVVWVVEHKRFMDARIMIMQAIAKISMIKTVKESNPASAPGSIYTKNEGIDVEFPKFDTGAAGAATDLESLAQMVGTALGWPTHYLLMSTETHRLASTVAMELPVLKNVEGSQSGWRDMLRGLYDYALLQAAKAGRLKAPVLYRHGHEMIDWAHAEPAPDTVDLNGTPRGGAGGGCGA